MSLTLETYLQLNINLVLITGVGNAPTEAGLWDPLEYLFAPLVNIIYNKHVLCFRFCLLRTESEAQQQLNAE